MHTGKAKISRKYFALVRKKPLANFARGNATSGVNYCSTTFPKCF